MQRSNSHEYQLGNSFEEEGAWLLMRLETGESVDCGYTQTLSLGRKGNGYLCSCGGGTTTRVHPAEGFPSITTLVDVDVGTKELCIVTVACPPNVLGVCVPCDRSGEGRDSLLKSSLVTLPLIWDSG